MARQERLLSGLDEAARDIGKLVARVARQYAPKSPTRAVLNRLRKTKGKTRRKKRATSGPKPGGLERSIVFSAGSNFFSKGESHVDIMVPANSEAGAYAARIHDEKGMSWSQRGPGTVQKGPLADDKFIERAIADSERDIQKIVRHHVRRALEA